MSTGNVGTSVCSSGGNVGNPGVAGGGSVEPAGTVASGVGEAIAVPVAVAVGVSLGTGVSVVGAAVSPAAVVAAGGAVAAGTSVAGSGVCVGTSVGVPAPQASVARIISISNILRAFIFSLNLLQHITTSALLLSDWAESANHGSVPGRFSFSGNFRRSRAFLCAFRSGRALQSVPSMARAHPPFPLNSGFAFSRFFLQ